MRGASHANQSRQAVHDSVGFKNAALHFSELKIRTLCRNAELRRCIGQAARLEAEEQHSWRHTAQQLEQIFTQVTAKVAPAV